MGFVMRGVLFEGMINVFTSSSDFPNTNCEFSFIELSLKTLLDLAIRDVPDVLSRITVVTVYAPIRQLMCTNQ